MKLKCYRNILSFVAPVLAMAILFHALPVVAFTEPPEDVKISAQWYLFQRIVVSVAVPFVETALIFYILGRMGNIRRRIIPLLFALSTLSWGVAELSRGCAAYELWNLFPSLASEVSVTFDFETFMGSKKLCVLVECFILSAFIQFGAFYRPNSPHLRVWQVFIAVMVGCGLTFSASMLFETVLRFPLRGSAPASNDTCPTCAVVRDWIIGSLPMEPRIGICRVLSPHSKLGELITPALRIEAPFRYATPTDIAMLDRSAAGTKRLFNAFLSRRYPADCREVYLLSRKIIDRYGGPAITFDTLEKQLELNDPDLSIGAAFLLEYIVSEFRQEGPLCISVDYSDILPLLEPGRLDSLFKKSKARLLTSLQDPDSEVRRYAILRQAECTQQVLLSLFDSLNQSSDITISEAAKTTLAALDCRPELLEPFLLDSSAKTRRVLVTLLFNSRTSEEDKYDSVLKLLDDSDAEVVRTTVESLSGLTAGFGFSGLQLSGGFLGVLQSCDDELRQRALESVGLTNEALSYELLERECDNEHASDSKNANRVLLENLVTQVNAIQWNQASVKEKERLFADWMTSIGHVLKDSNPELRYLGLKTLTRINELVLPVEDPDILPLLRLMVDDSNILVRAQLALALGSFGAENENHVSDSLKILLNDPAPIVFSSAASVLSGYKSKAARTLVVNILPKIAGFLEWDSTQRFANEMAALTIANLGRDASSAIPTIVGRYLDSPSPHGRTKYFVRALASMGRDAVWVLDRLQKLRNSSNVETRIELPDAFFSILGDAALPEVTPLLQDPSQRVRESAMRTLSISSLKK